MSAISRTFRAGIAAATITSTAVAAFADPVSVPERLMGDLQTDLELTDFQAAGVVGNLARETGNFRFLQEMNPLVRGSRGGLGYAQWTGPRRDAFEAFAGDADLTSYETNYAFLLEELDGPYERVLLRLMGTETAQEAAEVFMRGFLAPHPKYRHLEERVAFANAYLEGDFSGAGCASVHVTYEMGHIEAVAECPQDVAGVRPVPRPAWIEALHARDPDRVATDQIRVTDPFRTAEISGPEPS